MQDVSRRVCMVALVLVSFAAGRAAAQGHAVASPGKPGGEAAATPAW